MGIPTSIYSDSSTRLCSHIIPKIMATRLRYTDRVGSGAAKWKKLRCKVFARYECILVILAILAYVRVDVPLAIIRHTAARTTRALFLKILDLPRIRVGAYIRVRILGTPTSIYSYIRVVYKLRIFVYTVSRIDFLTFSFSYITSTYSYCIRTRTCTSRYMCILVIYEYIIIHLSDKWLIMFLTRTTVAIIYYTRIYYVAGDEGAGGGWEEGWWGGGELWIVGMKRFFGGIVKSI